MTELPLEAFTEEYFPEVVVDRESEKGAIKDYLLNTLKGIRKTLYVHGVPGIGKTTVVKHVLNQFEDSHNAEVIFINCASSTPNQALKTIHDRICGEIERKVPSHDLVARMLNKNIKEKNFALLIALDNFDKMDHIDDLLWNISGITPKFPRLGLIIISTSELNLKSVVGSRLYDRLKSEPYEFMPYNKSRLYEILTSRIHEAYTKKVVDDEALWALCSFIADNNGNVRTLFSLFMDALDLAQQERAKKMNVDMVNEIIQKEKLSLLRCKIAKMNRNDADILKTIAILTSEGLDIHTGMIIQSTKIKIPIRTLEYGLKNLEKDGLIELSKVRKGNGYSQSIKLTTDSGEILKILA